MANTEEQEPQEPSGPRYFTKEGEGIQEVYGLKDDQVYRDLGYHEVDEAAYQAHLAEVMGDPNDTSMMEVPQDLPPSESNG